MAQRLLNRQRVLLRLLDETGGSATHLQVTKWAFLLRRESPTCGGSAFYRFLPYHYGPFSFALYHEAGKLVQAGYLDEGDERTWRITEIGRQASEKLDRAITPDVLGITNKYARVNTMDLLAYVYERYPWFTLNSRTDRRVPRPCANPAVYTVGYEGLQVDEFLNGLLRRGISCLIDVRNNPAARRYGFHKTTLRRLCGNVGIRYEHYPELGIESRKRQGLSTQISYDRLFEQYVRDVLPAHPESIRRLADLTRGSAAALMCTEKEPVRCHRSFLAQSIAALAGLEVDPLIIAE